jgi:hypothetical protein
MISCVGTAPTKEVHLIDSLNQVAYSYRYKDLDSSCHAATQAYGKVNLYSQGKAEASNNLGFCAFMRMDFEKAEKFHKDVYSLTKNELELLVADIGLMKIYQRTAMNKEFYDYRNSALRRMKRIDEDNKLFVDKHERLRLNYARSEFYIVSAVYYYYLQQRAEAMASLNEIRQNEELAADTTEDSPYLFPFLEGMKTGEDAYKEYNTVLGGFNRRLKTLSESIGIRTRVTSYTIRHSFATTLKEQNVPIEMISELLGHKSIKTTQIYLKSFSLEKLSIVNKLCFESVYNYAPKVG